MGCGSSRQTHIVHATPRPDQLAELEMLFKALHLERVLAACFARGTTDDPLQAFFSQQPSDVVAAVRKAGPIIVEMVAGLIKKQNEARAKDQGAGGG